VDAAFLLEDSDLYRFQTEKTYLRARSQHERQRFTGRQFHYDLALQLSEAAFQWILDLQGSSIRSGPRAYRTFC